MWTRKIFMRCWRWWRLTCLALRVHCIFFVSQGAGVRIHQSSEPTLSPADGLNQDRQIKSRGCFVQPEPGVCSLRRSHSSPPAGFWCDQSQGGADKWVLKIDFLRRPSLPWTSILECLWLAWTVRSQIQPSWTQTQAVPEVLPADLGIRSVRL